MASLPKMNENCFHKKAFWWRSREGPVCVAEGCQRGSQGVNTLISISLSWWKDDAHTLVCMCVNVFVSSVAVDSVRTHAVSPRSQEQHDAETQAAFKLGVLLPSCTRPALCCRRKSP